jgi:hypothetical protein
MDRSILCHNYPFISFHFISLPFFFSIFLTITPAMKNQRSKPGPAKKEKRPPSDRPLKKPREGKTSATSLSSTKSSDSESSMKEEEQMPPPPPYHPPSMARLLVRFWQSLAALGALGFQIGASPCKSIHA